MSILALDVAGVPRTWLSKDDAISYHAKGLVAWTLGEVVARYRGGIQHNGERSFIETPSIIAINGHGFNFKKHRKVVLTNRTLFSRDRHLCAYCGNHFVSSHDLSRDHIMPKFHGGQDEWTNVVTSCMPCNQKKGCLTLKESGMELRYIPYEPSHAESLILQNRNILVDQMEYLLPMVPKHSRILDIAA